MNLKSRLSQLKSQAGANNTKPASKPSVSELRARIEQLEANGRTKRATRHCEQSETISQRSQPASEIHALTGIPGGDCRVAGAPRNDERTGDSRLFFQGEAIADGVIRIQKRFPLTGELGSVALHALRNRPCLPGERASEHLRNVYIDTETTGLSGGSGTLAFLIGIAVIEEDAIALTQFLMTGFSGEAASLSAFAELLGPNDQLVSYNGKSYDLPLLITRFRMQALRHPFDGLQHLDLLHPVRRLFSSRWNDCRLISVEENLLGFNRVDDLPGSEAPEAWFGYIRNGYGAQLVKVVEHNQQDIVSLAVAHSVLTQAIEQPHAFDVDLYALARWLAEHDETHARQLLQSHEESLCDDGQRLLGHLLRRAGHWPQAIAVWEALAAKGCADSLERLAKYHEHISKDLAKAKRCCERLPRSAARAHRSQRIERKLQQI
jgi:uncharacterized protein YprB with RNaseH-like and TPR domain